MRLSNTFEILLGFLQASPVKCVYPCTLIYLVYSAWVEVFVQNILMQAKRKLIFDFPVVQEKIQLCMGCCFKTFALVLELTLFVGNKHVGSVKQHFFTKPSHFFN
jgi:hypothetical protein